MTADPRIEPLVPFIRRMPKVELHVHLEGSIQPRTLLALAARHGVDLPADDERGIREWFQFRDFAHFVDIYLRCSECLRDPEDFQCIVADFMAEQARQNVLYTEAHFTISTHLANGASGDEVAQALDEAMAAGRRHWDVELKLVTDIVRNVGVKAADETLAWALGPGRSMVVALGLSGFESVSNEPYREHFRTARDEGLHRVAHAGEHGGPESVISALDDCLAERIGHGVNAIRDSALVDRLAAERIPLEVCPTSNVCLGVVPEPAAHPFDRLRRAGVEVSVNSDDPPYFGSTLTEEYQLVGRLFGYGAEDLEALTRTALRHAFLPSTRRAELTTEFSRQFAALQAVQDTADDRS